jgi:hypothetical protein
MAHNSKRPQAKPVEADPKNKLVSKRWVWDLYPLAKDSWGAWELDDDEQRPDHRIYLRRRKGEGFLYPPLSLTELSTMIVERRAAPDDFAVREGYAPTAADVELLRRVYPSADPYRPDWYTIKADLVAAGHGATALDKSEAPVLLALLRAVPGAEPRRANDPDEMVSPATIAKRFGLTRKQMDRLRKTLANWRSPTNCQEWTEFPDRKPRQSPYLYRLGSIQHLIDSAQSAG